TAGWSRGGRWSRCSWRWPPTSSAISPTSRSTRVSESDAMSTPAIEERIEERHGFPEALRASGGVGGHIGAPHAVWRRRLAALGASRPATAGLGIVLVWLVLAILAPAIAPHNPNANDVAAPPPPTPSPRPFRC